MWIWLLCGEIAAGVLVFMLIGYGLSDLLVHWLRGRKS